MEFTGMIGKGRGQGGVYGFPTANIPLEAEAVSGVYAAQATIDGTTYPAAAYADQSRKILEAHLLDFDGELYGKQMTVRLLKQIREDDVFPTEAELLAQIKKDVEDVRAFFKT
jgi:riboflavin kinase/FMN adenylyltransferase